MATHHVAVVGTVLLWCIDIAFSGTTNPASFGPYNFVHIENPVSLYEAVGVREVNKFTSGGLYRATINENAGIGSYASSPVKMGLYVQEGDAKMEYVVNGIRRPTQQTTANCSGINTFVIEGKRIKNFFALSLRTKRMLIEESCKSYLVTIEARYETKRTIDTTKVYIEVQVASSMQPRFYATSRLARIPLSFPLFQPILQLNTTDNDNMGKVYFLLETKSKYFALNPVNGVLFLKRSLPAASRHHDLAAYVKNWDSKLIGKTGQLGLDSTCQITIKVTSVNQYAPSITVDEVPDNIGNKSNSLVATITVSDPDKGRNGKIASLLISSRKVREHFFLEKVTKNNTFYRLHLTKPFSPQFSNPSLTFIATDKGHPPKISTTVHHFKRSLTFSNKLHFPKDDYFVNISEMMPVNATVIQINVQNLRPDSIFFYSIVQGNSANKFRINSNTGEIYVAGTLDAETTSLYLLKVAFNVIGDNPEVKSTKVHIEVEDFNDHAPRFTPDNHYVEIQEDMALHTSIYQVSAKDDDSGDNGLVSYWLPDTGQFSIHRDTGKISVKRVSDRDSGIPEYTYLVVRAGDNGSPIRRETETMVKIKIKAWNDNAPVIKQNDCTVTLSTDTPVGTKVVQIQALDIDVDQKNQPSFSLTMGNTGDYFSLDTSTGDVTVAKPLGDAHTSYTLVISANDGTHESSNDAVLQIKIQSKRKTKHVSCTDSAAYTKALKLVRSRHISTPVKPVIDSKPPHNSQAPHFPDRHLIITVPEDIALGSTLKVLKAVDGDNGYEGLVTYYIVGGNHNQRFAVDALTGKLKTIAELDREQVAKYELNISAWDSGSPRKTDFIRVTVTVKDVNDNPPIFEQKFYNISVPENTHVGTTILKLLAKDKDIQANQRVTYQLVNDYNKLFLINYKSGELIINKALDFEKEKFHKVKVLAMDGSLMNHHITQADILINVLDKNDNPPVINPVIQTVYLMKDFPIQSPITQVTAHDPDSGNGGNLRFVLVASYGSQYFSMGAENGLLTLKRSLASTTAVNFNLTITVSDRGQTALTSNAYVNVYIVQRINDKTGQISSKYSSIMEYTIPENVPAGYQIVQLTKNSQHSDSQSLFSFSIIDGTDVTVFNVDDASGLLTTTASLDHEKIPYYWLTIRVVTRQSRQFLSNIQLLVKVGDENDNDPVFIPPVYKSKIPENIKANRMVAKVSAVDKDSGDNGRLTYSITTGNDEGHFKIDSSSGIITTTHLQLDYEKKKMFLLTVSATDNGPTGKQRKTEALLTIFIQDENDNEPKFKKHQNIDFLIPDTNTDIPNGTLLGQILASDKDSGDNGELTFKILHGNQDGKLRIDPKSGQLFSHAILNSFDFFSLKIEVKDNGQPVLSAKTAIQVTMTPQSTSRVVPNPLSFPQKEVNISLEEDTPVGHKTTIIHATNTYNDILMYLIKSGNEEQKFQLNSFGNSLELIAELSSPVYHLVIVATNGFHSCNFTLNVQVKDINNHYPIAEMVEKIARVPENVALGTRVVTVAATDLDSGINAQIRYSLKSAVDPKSLTLFDIDENTGEITVKGLLNYEDMRSHVLIVAMTDRGDKPKESTMYVIVNVDDVNEWKPNFIKPSYHAIIQENLPRGSDVIKVQAVDKDQGLDAIIKYSITAGNHGFAFSIQPQSGVIQTNRVLKASHISEYVLTVEARDDGSHALSETTNVTVKLLTRGYRPGFSKKLFYASVYENQPLNTVVAYVGFYGLMTLYSITKATDCSSGFHINQFTGVITTEKLFDAEKISSCVFTVRAEDSDGYSQELTVNIDIKDLNDNRPIIEKRVFTGYVEENSKKNTLILNGEGKPLVITAHDKDVELQHREVKYEIISPPGDYFERNDNGILVTSKVSLDYEKQQSYSLLVKVSNTGLPSLFDIATVIVHVKNNNDVAPVFSKTLYDVPVYLPTYKGVLVSTLTASDPDKLGEMTFSISQQDTSSLLDINPSTGEVFIDDPSKAREGWYNAVVEVSDGKLKGRAKLRVVFKRLPVTSLQFSRSFYQAHARENTSVVQTVLTPFVKGYNLRQTLWFALGNLQHIFIIKKSTGVIKTKPGVILDREQIPFYKLVINVHDDSVPPRVAHSVVYVIVDDVNDCPPTFPPPPIFFVVPKSSKSGSIIATVNASDCDDGKNGKVRYGIKSDKNGIFAIDPSSGALKVLGQLVGLPTPTEFNLVVTAKDLGDSPLQSEAKVSVRIESGDACIFEKPSYIFELAEDTDTDKVIQRLHARCPNGRPIFSIMAGDNFSEVTIDLNTGELSLTSKLDFETRPSYILTVRAKDSKTGASSQATVRILVKDINDNAPTFEGVPYFVRVRESSPKGTKLLRVFATDLDSGDNQKRSYELVAQAGEIAETFAINNVSGVLQIKKKLDYEKNKRFYVKVRVYDHGEPSLSSEALVMVSVRDENDNVPVFERSHYSVTVLENAGPNQFVTHVFATDADENDISKLRYEIVSGRGKEYFRVDSESGVVSLSKIPGLVLGQLYTLKLSVNDGNFTAYTTLDVVIGQVNNHRPKFQANLIFAQVSENYPADSYVAMVTATDHDAGDFGEVVYSIDSQRVAHDFKVDKVTGIITTRKPLDRELMSSTTIPIRATDKGGKSAFCNVQVRITDENDNQPQFLMPAYTAVVAVSRALVGGSVTRVTAVDPDEGENSALTYSLVGQTSPFVFGINSTSGAITFLRKPRESTYSFYARVSDDGHFKLKSYAQVHVSIDSLIFQFRSTQYDVFISESVKRSVVERLELIDDNGARVSSGVDYAILVGTNPQTNKLKTFSINSMGELQVSKDLDYETVQSYDLTVRANRSSFSIYTKVHVEILDENDNKPEFQSDIYNVSVPEDSPRGTKIVQVRAQDKDSKKNGLVTYEMSIESKVFSNVFKIDPLSGWITTKGDLDRETIPFYNLKVDAKDHGANITLKSSTRVRITIDDVNDSPPVFSRRIYTISIREDSPIGSQVLTLNTTDKDANSRVLYYIVSGDRDNRFNISQISGKIHVNAKLDREMFPRYLLNVTASDGAYIDSTLVNIEILDVNDNKPICLQTMFRVPVFENITVGTPIAAVNVTDNDAANNSRITFTISTHVEKFSIDALTGIVKLDKELDREEKSSHNFIVSASDGNDACDTNITVDVLDVNDNPPIFTKAHYTKPVPINSEINAVLLTVEAIDDDVGLNRLVSYAFTNASTSLIFSIEKETGIISLKSQLLSRDEEKFVFDVIATDSGVPPLSSQTTVEIVVSTIKNCPFLQTEYEREIREDSKPTSEIETVSVTCIGDKFTIIYRIADGDDEARRLFTINENTGKLSLKAALDYETTRVHIFTVVALIVKPSGKTILVSSATVKIKVVDCNDNKPVFEKTIYEATVKEGNYEVSSAQGNSKPFVVQVYAHDKDPSNVVRYTIRKSSPDASKFEIDAISGIITVNGSLDREKTDLYELTVRARDSGNPSLSSDVRVVIKIKDVNDNPPVVQKEIKKLVPTDVAAGTVILHLTPTDADGPSNSKPFKFSVLSGENDVFKLNSSSGQLTTQKRLSLHNTTFTMVLRTTDSGSPPMYADTIVDLTAVKSSLNPPEVRPVTIHLNMFAKKFNGGIIGKVVAHDPDKDSILQFSLVKGDAQFSIGLRDGKIEIHSALNPRTYSLEVQVTDGTHIVNTQVTVRAKEITSSVVQNSVTIRIKDKTLSSFVSSSLSSMIKTLTDINSCTADEVYLWSIQTAPNKKLDVVFAIKKPGKEEFEDPNQLRETLEDQLNKFETLSNVDVYSVGIFPCDERQCPRGQECRNRIKMLDHWSILSSGAITFLSYKNEQYRECGCLKGVTDCPKLSECDMNPCKPGLLCVENPRSGYKCVCPKGQNCEKDCHSDKCHADAMMFNGDSYIRYSMTNEKAKLSSFAVSVRTTKPSGTILAVKGAYDYFILEIVEGKIRVRFNYGSGEGIGRIDQVKMNDGKWHDIKVTRKERNVRLTLNPGGYMAEPVALGPMRFLNVDMKNIIVGGELPRKTNKGKRSTVSNGYFGCMENPRLNDNDLPLSGSNGMAKATAQGVAANCSIDVCHPSFCHNDGQCKIVEENGHKVPSCICKPGFTAYDCSEDVNECDSIRCENSGVCVNTIGSFTCNCVGNNFKGSLCDQPVAALTQTEPLGTREFIYIGTTVFVLIIIAIVIVFVCRCSHKRRRKAKANKNSHEMQELKSKMNANDDEMLPHPPPPPPRRGDVDDPGPRLGSRAPSWDYADVPELNRKKLGDSDSFLCLPGKSFEELGECSGASGIPQVPKRPRHIGEPSNIPDVPEKPSQYRSSRASSQMSVAGYADVSEIGEEGLAIIRQGTKEIDKLLLNAADVVDGLLGTRCAVPPSECDARSECSDDDEPYVAGHLETYDGNEVDYFIPEADQDTTSANNSDDEASTMLEKIPNVRTSRGEIRHKESQI